MRILHLDYDDADNPYAGGGQAKATFNINSILVKRHSITVLTGSYPGAKEKTDAGVKFKPIGIGFLGPTVSLLSYWFLLPLYVLSLQKNFDLIVEFFTAPFAISLVPRVAAIPVIGCTSFFHSELLQQKYKIPFDSIRKWGLKKYRYIIALNDALKDKIRTEHPDCQVTVIPRGVEKKLLEGTSKDGKDIVYLGRIDMFQKGLDLLLQAVEPLLKRNPDRRLIIAGSGKDADLQTLNNLIQERGLTDRITLAGTVRGDERYDLLLNASIIVCPSRFETFGITALEALAAGKPLLCFDIEGYSWIPQDGAMKVPSFDTDLFGSELEKLLTDKNLRAQLSKKARAFAKQLTWDEIAKRYETLYTTITG